MSIKTIDDSWAMLTTACPKCGTEFTRKMWIDAIIAGCALDLCNSCTTDFVIIENTYV